MGKAKKKASPSAEKRKRFAEEYVVDLNATKAAERAGYSPKTAYAQGHRLLKDAETQALITEMKTKRSAATADLATRVLNELAIIAFADIGEVIEVQEDGKIFVRDLQTLTPETRRAIGEITQTSTERTEGGHGGESMATIEKIRTGVKHHSKVAALKLLMDHLGMYAPTKQEITGKDGKPIETRTEVKAGRGLSKDVARQMAMKVLGIPEHLLPAVAARPQPQEPAAES